jgi:hypothetical protein
MAKQASAHKTWKNTLTLIIYGNATGQIGKRKQYI